MAKKSRPGDKERRRKKDALRREKDREREELRRANELAADSVLAEILPRLPGEPNDLWYFQQVQDFCVDSKGNMAIGFKPRQLARLVRESDFGWDSFAPEATVSPVVVLEKRRRSKHGENWYFHVKVLFYGQVNREWSEKVSDCLRDHAYMLRTGKKKIPVWGIREVHKAFIRLLGLEF